MLLFFYKVVELVGVGSVINKAYPYFSNNRPVDSYLYWNLKKYKKADLVSKSQDNSNKEENLENKPNCLA